MLVFVCGRRKGRGRAEQYGNVIVSFSQLMKTKHLIIAIMAFFLFLLLLIFSCIVVEAIVAVVVVAVVALGLTLFDKGLGWYFIFLEEFFEHEGGMIEIPIGFLKASERGIKTCVSLVNLSFLSCICFIIGLLTCDSSLDSFGSGHSYSAPFAFCSRHRAGKDSHWLPLDC